MNTNNKNNIKLKKINLFIKIELRGIKKKGNKLFLLKKYFKYLKNSKNKSVLNKIKSFILEN